MLKQVFLPIAILSICSAMFFSPVVVAEDVSEASKLELGKELAFNRFKGNCLACHFVEGGELTGNYGPPLVYMKARYPDREALRAQIWDAATKNPDTRMPPFGRNRILTEEEIDLVTDYIQTL